MNLRTLIFALAFTWYVFPLRAEEPNFCNESEILIAGCVLHEPRARSVSLCAASDRKTISYTFGTADKKELEHTFSRQRPLHRWMDTATYTTYLGFRISEYSYVFGIPSERYGVVAFLDVSRGSQRLMTKLCTQNSFGEGQLNSEAVREIDDASVRNNGFIFPTE
jgi:hypothetical protein